MVMNKTRTMNGKTASATPIPSRRGTSRSPEFATKTIQESAIKLRTALEQHVFGQRKMIAAVVAAVLSGINLCLVGKSGIGKTHAAETLLKILNFKGQTLPLNPDVTCADITGYMALDLETRKKVYWPSPFLQGNQMIVLDELNRASDKAQVSLLDILNGKRVIVEGVKYPISDIFTTIMTMNPPEDPGTRPIHNALADRIDFVLPVFSPSREAMGSAITYSCSSRGVTNYIDNSEEMIRQARLGFKSLLNLDADLQSPVAMTAVKIVNGFQGDDWETPASVRTGAAMVKSATIFAALKGKTATAEDVWTYAPRCLGMLKHRDYMSTEERLRLIQAHVNEIRSSSS